MATQTAPDDFRDLGVIPTREDIMMQGRPPLKENKIKGRYEHKIDYLDVQFRLLREDFIRPLRDGIQQILVMGKHRTKKDERLLDVRVYDNVEVLEPVYTSNGITYRIRFDLSKFHGVEWENSKRLIFGSLLCLSKDNFDSLSFATVAERKDVYKGVIEVRFVSPTDEGRPRTGDMCQMVESIAFFEAYRPILEGLQMMSYGREFPFQRYIVECQKEVFPPAYLTKRDGQQVQFDFSPIICRDMWSNYRRRQLRNCRSFFGPSGSNVTVLEPASWPSPKDLQLDESQFNALQLALTKEFAVIQGPPGTGKTYIGLKIAKVLLHNKELWCPVRNKGHLLVVCYTNHALDQFLEEIHAFHKTGIVRVGGRSQSEAIQECSLSKWKRKGGLIPKHLKEQLNESKDKMDNFSEKIASDSKIIGRLTTNVIDEDELRRFAKSFSSQHYESLKRNMEGSKLAVPHWLGLPVEPADPYKEGFAQPLVMFPCNGQSWDLEFFSQLHLANISGVRPAPGADGTPTGSLELFGHCDSFIEIPNFEYGFVDAGRSITILAFVYPTGGTGPIICYERCGYAGVQIWHEQNGFDVGMGTLVACFMRRDLAVAFPVRKNILEINEWNFIGASYDHNSGMARLWHNGNEVEYLFLGKNFPLATQFPIRIGAFANPWQENFFTGRISHVHIYSEALGVENIRAVGCIPWKELDGLPGSFSDSIYKKYEHETVVAEDEIEISSEGDQNGDVDEDSDDEEDEDKEYSRESSQKPPDVRFEAYVIQDQRILDSDDDVIRFDNGGRADDGASTVSFDVSQAARGIEEGLQGGGWKFQNPARVRKKIKQIIQRELRSEDMMREDEASQVEDVWKLSEKDRWRLYRRWVHDAREKCHENISYLQQRFETLATIRKTLKEEEDYYILSEADVIGMTTTGAARYHGVLQQIGPEITIVEEAAEVLEAHVVTSLTQYCQHLILIGDHQQLRPNPTVYDLQIKYNFDVSLFERMVKNGMEFARLRLQHRMRPEIAKMLDHIYVNPKLENHHTVLKFEAIKGVTKNLFFVDHDKQEDFVAEGKSRSNDHEAKFMTALCRYFVLQGYNQKQITILAAYTGQLFKFKREMSAVSEKARDKKLFEGVRVTVVDNFQGEENDIILLSLVRSDRIGFLKISNRVCVALSRARKGFYIIGNATLLARDSDLWRNIFADMQEQGTMGKELRLTCHNHPEKVIQATCAEDFEDAPEGGCKKPCGIKLKCGHTCNQVCHPTDVQHKEKFSCRQPCPKIICNLGHKCRKRCGVLCGPCKERVIKVIPECNHEQNVPCSEDIAKFKCKKIMPKEAFPCGHTNEVECSVQPSQIKCEMPCGELQCGHKCVGNCSKCLQGRLHLPCESQCSRSLFCGHTCQDDCIRACPPCSEKCGNYCSHRMCKRKCGDPCQPCKEECSWQCPHHICTKPCGEPCDRPRCNEPCQKKLPCDHLCVGVCGEECPKLCRNCNEEADEFCGYEPEAMFVELVDCGHIFEVKTLDRWMDESEVEERKREEFEIKHKRCPKCSTPILFNHRYGKIIKKLLADFEAIKRQIVVLDVADSGQVQRILKEVQEIKGFRSEVDEITQSITKGHVTYEEVIKRQNEVVFLQWLDRLQLYTIRNLARVITTDKTVQDKIQYLKSRVMQKNHYFSEQEIKELTKELSSTKLLVCFKDLMAYLQNKAITLSPEENSCVCSIQNALDSGDNIGHQAKMDFMASINRIIQKHRLPRELQTVDSETELNKMIVRTRTFTRGPWFKCNKAHVYSISERIEDGSSIKCPRCLAEVTEPPQRQTEATSAQVTPSQMKKITAKPSATQRTRPWNYRPPTQKHFNKFRR